MYKFFLSFLHWGKFIDHMIFLLRLVYKELHDSMLLWITTTLEFQFRGVLCVSINLYVNIYFLWCLSFTFLPFDEVNGNIMYYAMAHPFTSA